MQQRRQVAAICTYMQSFLGALAAADVAVPIGYFGSGFTIKPNYEDHIGSLKAIDPDSGGTVWELKNPAPAWGGEITPVGGLVFTGTPEGEFIAHDDATGEFLWSFQTGSGIFGQPITREHDGEQYVTVISGWGRAVPL